MLHGKSVSGFRRAVFRTAFRDRQRGKPPKRPESVREREREARRARVREQKWCMFWWLTILWERPAPQCWACCWPDWPNLHGPKVLEREQLQVDHAVCPQEGKGWVPSRHGQLTRWAELFREWDTFPRVVLRLLCPRCNNQFKPQYGHDPWEPSTWRKGAGEEACRS